MWRLLALCLMLAGCGGGSAPEAGRPTVNPPAFGDADPTDWAAVAPGRAPGDYRVHGIDVARFQGAVDWNAAQRAGVSFAFIKATEGGDLLDPQFARNWAAAGRAGVPRGAYHFWYHCREAAEQAAWFIRNVPRSAGALPPVLDLEWTPFSPTCTRRPPAEEVRAQALEFLRLLERHYGQRPLIYTSIDFYEDNDLGRLAGHEFWLRSVAGAPGDIYPGQPWTFWQYSGTGLVPGSTGKTDLNVFRGGVAEWGAWLDRRAR